MNFEEIQKFRKEVVAKLYDQSKYFAVAHQSLDDSVINVGHGIHKSSTGFGITFNLVSEEDRYLFDPILNEYGKDNIRINVTGVAYALSSLGHGCRISHQKHIYGSLGCFVYKNDKLCLLSNTHVLKGYNQPESEKSIFLDNTHIADLIDHDPLNKVLSDNEALDAGVAVLLNQEHTPITNLKGFRDKSFIMNEAEESYQVWKNGSKTGETTGYLVSYDIEQPIFYSGWANSRFNYHNLYQIETEDGSSFSDFGDSGSIIYDKDRHAVGLLIASNMRGCSWAHPIDLVLNRFGVNLLTCNQE